MFLGKILVEDIEVAFRINLDAKLFVFKAIGYKSVEIYSENILNSIRDYCSKKTGKNEDIIINNKCDNFYEISSDNTVFIKTFHDNAFVGKCELDDQKKREVLEFFASTPLESL